MMRRMCHCEGSQSKLLFSWVQKLRWSLLYLAVWVVWSVALFYCQIFQPNLDTLANSRVLPPKQNKQILSPPIWTFCCCRCFIWCFALSMINLKPNYLEIMAMVIWHLMKDNFVCVLLPDMIPHHIPHKNSMKSHVWKLNLGADSCSSILLTTGKSISNAQYQ